MLRLFSDSDAPLINKSSDMEAILLDKYDYFFITSTVKCKHLNTVSVRWMERVHH